MSNSIGSTFGANLSVKSERVDTKTTCATAFKRFEKGDLSKDEFRQFVKNLVENKVANTKTGKTIESAAKKLLDVVNSDYSKSNSESKQKFAQEMKSILSGKDLFKTVSTKAPERNMQETKMDRLQFSDLHIHRVSVSETKETKKPTFDHMLSHSKMKAAFEVYSRDTEFSPENMAFYNAVNRYLQNPDFESGVKLYKQFIEPHKGSSFLAQNEGDKMEVNVPSATQDLVKKAIANTSADELKTALMKAQDDIRRMMVNDSFKRFCDQPKLWQNL